MEASSMAEILRAAPSLTGRLWLLAALAVAVPLAATAQTSGAARPSTTAAAEAAARAEASFERYRAVIREAVVARNDGRHDDSLRSIAQAEAIDEAEGVVSMPTQFHKGLTLAAMSRHEEAIAAFDRGLAVQKDYPLAWWHRALSDEALGRRDAARADLERFGSLIGPWVRQRGKLDPQRRAEFREKLAQYGLERKYRF